MSCRRQRNRVDDRPGGVPMLSGSPPRQGLLHGETPAGRGRNTVSLHPERRVALRRILLAALVLIAAWAPAAPAAPTAATVVGLEVDGRADEPLGVDDRSPVLSWRVSNAPDGWTQSAYQVRAAAGEADLEAGRYLWDTGRVQSAEQTDVPYAGPPLESRRRIAWQVRGWDA